MNIVYDENECRINIEDIERASWLKGSDIYYSIPKDERPSEFNPYEVSSALQAYYDLDRLTSRNTSKEVSESLDSLKNLAMLFDDYANNVLGMILKDK